MNLLLLLALAVPLSCLAFLSLLVLLGVATLGAVIHVLGAIRRADPNGLASNKRTTLPGSYLHPLSAKGTALREGYLRKRLRHYVRNGMVEERCPFGRSCYFIQRGTPVSYRSSFEDLLAVFPPPPSP